MKINQLKAGVILSYISELIVILSGLVYTPVMLRLLGQSEYGLYQLATSTIAYLNLLTFGFGSAYVRYYSRHKVNNDEVAIAKLNGMFMTIFTVLAVICIIAGTVLVLSTDMMFKTSLSIHEIKTTKILMGFMIFNLAITFPGSVFVSHITANEQYVFQRIVNILKNLFNPLLTLPLLLLGYKSVSLVVVQTILTVAAFLVNAYFCRKKLKMSFDFKGFEIGFLKELFAFSFFIFLNQIIDQVNWSVGKFILGIISGSIAVAVYGVAAQINSLYLMFSSSISNVFTPRVNKIVAESNDDKILTDLFTRVGRIQFIIMFLILSGLVVFGQYFIQIWAGQGYEEAYWMVLLLVIPVTVPLIQNLGVEIQRAKNMHQFRSIVYAGIAIANIFLSIPLVKLYGGIGAAAGTAISLLIGNGLIMNIYYHKKIGLDIIYFWKQIVAFIPALILPTILAVIIMKFIAFNSIIIFGLTIILYTLVYCVSMWLFGMNQYEKELLKKPLQKLFRK